MQIFCGELRLHIKPGRIRELVGVNPPGANRFKQLLIRVTRQACCCDPLLWWLRVGVGVKEEEGKWGATPTAHVGQTEFLSNSQLLPLFLALEFAFNVSVVLWTASFAAYLSPFERRFWTFLLLGLLSLPTHWMPPGPVTFCDSRPLDDFLKVNSTSSPSFRLRKPSMCNLLWKESNESMSKRESELAICLILPYDVFPSSNKKVYNLTGTSLCSTSLLCWNALELALLSF